jgi:antitoxin FitA
MTRRNGSGSSSRVDSRSRGLLGRLPETLVSLKSLRGKISVVVALQIRGVSEPTRRTLSAEARARGESLQEFLLDVLDREARDIDNRRLIAEWDAGPSVDQAQRVEFVQLLQPERQGQPT